jgi:hypothetical protein
MRPRPVLRGVGTFGYAVQLPLRYIDLLGLSCGEEDRCRKVEEEAIDGPGEMM